MSNRTPEEVLSYCDAATSGPWEWDIDYWPRLIAKRDGVDIEIARLGEGAVVPNADDLFLSAAREDLPRMAKRVMELENALTVYMSEYETPVADYSLRSLLRKQLFGLMEARDADE